MELFVNVADVDLDHSTPSIAIGITYDTACRRQVVRSDTATRRARQRATRQEASLSSVQSPNGCWEAGSGKLGERGTPDEAPVAHHDVEMGAPLPYASGFERDRELGKRALGCFVFGLEAVSVEHFAFEFGSCLGFGWWTARVWWRLVARSGLQGMLTVIPARPRE